MRTLPPFIAVCVAFTTVLASSAHAEKTRKDSVKLVVTGCFSDRLLRASDIVVPDGAASPTIHRQTFRLSGKKNVVPDERQHEDRRLAVTGWVRKIDLQEPGLRLKGGRVVIGAPAVDPTRMSVPDTGDRPVVLDVISFERLPEPCTPKGR